MSRNVVYTLHLWPPIAHAKHYTGSALERRLAERLTDHALGRGARLTQVQVERGGFWLLAQTQPGGRLTERRLKQHGATRRCEVCKAVDGFRSGELAEQEALARAGWDRSNPVQRSMLLEIFGLPQPPEVTAGPQPAEPKPFVPAPRPEPLPAVDPEMDALTDALIAGWRAEAGLQPEAGTDRELEAAS